MNAPKLGWWSKNWRWIAPLGCLGAIVSTVVLGVMVMWALQGSGAYAHAMARIERSPAAAEALGQPIRSGLVMRGKVQQDEYSGQAVMSVPVYGPKGQGTLKIGARRKPNGRWEFSRLLLEVEGRPEPIDLLHEGAPPETAPDAGQR